jgi:hypothetical protein
MSPLSAPGHVDLLAVDAVTGERLSAGLSTTDAADLLSGAALSFAPTPTVREDFQLVGDPDDPREAGWVVIVGATDPARDQLTAALAPLADHRGGPTSWGPLAFPAGIDVGTWIDDAINTRDPVPGFVLLAGSPTQLPFELQSALACLASVGRLDFTTIADGVETQHPELFAAYVAKVLAAEEDDVQPVDRASVFWAPSKGGDDPTVYSRALLAAPLADRAEKHGFQVTRLFDNDATSSRLLEASCGDVRPALVFTASHGLAVPGDAGHDVQASRNGLPVGQDGMALRVAELPGSTDPVVEAGLVFQFACFGYGTPAASGYTHWWDRIPQYQAPFEMVSPLPKALVAHPRGPLGYIGHADYAVLHSFADAADPLATPTDGSGGRMAPFRSSLDVALTRDRRLGRVLDSMVRQLALLNNGLVTIWNNAQHRHRTPGFDTDLVNRFIRRNDARYYFLLGDPAATIPLAEAQ